MPRYTPKPFTALILMAFALLLPHGVLAAPALWHLSDDDTSIHIFGTLHLLSSDTVWENAVISKAFLESDALIPELDDQELTKAGPIFAEAGRLPRTDHLRHHVGSGIYNDVMRLARQLDMPANAFDGARPWFAGMSLTVVSLVKAGFDPASGVDRYLIDRALNLRKPILGIETAEQQAAIFAGLSAAQEKALLVNSLKQSQNVKQEFTSLQTAWLAGDLAALDKILNGSVETVDGLGETLLYARNRDWAHKLALVMQRPGRYFVAVGSAHLVGEQSLIEELTAVGYTPDRVQ